VSREEEYNRETVPLMHPAQESVDIAPNKYSASSWMAYCGGDSQLSIAREDSLNWDIRSNAEHMVLYIRHTVHV
jgi:hypothetical protein